MRFLLIPSPATPETAPPATEEPFDEELFKAHMRYNEEMHKAGILVASEGLSPLPRAAHVRMAKGQRTVVDGPFAETKELIAGFWLIDVKSKEEAIEWALRCPLSPGKDEVLEIRPLTGANDIPAELVRTIEAVAPTWSAAFHRS